MHYMLNVKTEKSIDEALQEEFLRERAVVLAKAGEKLTKTLHLLDHIEECIAKDTMAIGCLSNQENAFSSIEREIITQKKVLLAQINQNIDTFNKTREKAKIQYYYLIVTREALGLRKHHWVEELYSIPPAKKAGKDR
jgi:hypothetical protein